MCNRNRLPWPGFIIPCTVYCFALLYFVINACISHIIITLIRYFVIPKSRDLVSHNPGISGLKNGPGSRDPGIRDPGIAIPKRNATKNTSDVLLVNLLSLPSGGADCNLCFIESLFSTAEYHMQFTHAQLSLYSLPTPRQIFTVNRSVKNCRFITCKARRSWHV